MVGTGATRVLDGEVVYHQCERYREGIVTEEAGGVGCLVVTMLGEQCAELCVRKATGLWESIDAFGDADHGPVVVPCDLGAILGEDVGWHLVAGEPHILGVLEVGPEIEVADVSGHEFGIFGDYGVEEKLEGLHVGGVARAVAGVVGDVAAVGAAYPTVQDAILDLEFDLGIVIGGGAGCGFLVVGDPGHGFRCFEEATQFVRFFGAPEVAIPG